MLWGVYMDEVINKLKGGLNRRRKTKSICAVCGIDYKKRGNNCKYCLKCSPIQEKIKEREYQQKPKVRDYYKKNHAKRYKDPKIRAKILQCNKEYANKPENKFRLKEYQKECNQMLLIKKQNKEVDKAW